MSSITSKLFDIVEGFKTLPQKIGDKIKATLVEIFVPDKEVVKNQLEAFTETLKMRLGFDVNFFGSLFDGELPVQDINADYDLGFLGTFNLKFFDTKFLYEGVTYFRPFIRGFIVLMLAMYNVRMALSFIRQDAGFVAGKAVSVSSKEE